MKTFILYQHAGSCNHGCEALVRTVVETIRQVETDKCRFILLSGKAASDFKYGLDEVPDLTIRQLNNSLHRFGLNWIKLQAGKIFKNVRLQQKSRYNLDGISDDAIFVAIGGDNYCYKKGKDFYEIDNIFKGKKILWGCSIEPSDLDGELCSHLKGFSVITARESITYKALIDKGFKNVKLIPDTAFVLPYDEVETAKGDYIGINISPMILKYAQDRDIVIKSYQELISHIISNTDMNVMLIPHVCEDGNDDRETLLTLIQNMSIDRERVMIIPDMKCLELKGYIRQCRFFIGARTHATIAAYSSGVPTLVVGYSVKSKGIACDIFGDCKQYVIPVSDIKTGSELCNAFLKLWDMSEKMTEQEVSYTNTAQQIIQKEYHEVLKEL